MHDRLEYKTQDRNTPDQAMMTDAKVHMEQINPKDGRIVMKWEVRK